MASDSSTVAKDDKNMSSFIDSRRQTSFLMAQAGIRILVVAFTLVAISVTVTNSQTVVVFGMNFQAHYTYSSALKFLVAANAVLCSFSALSLVYIYSLSRSGTTSPLKKHFFLFLLDTVMIVLITAGCAAATAIGYVGKYGEEHMTWQPTCGYVSKFCNRMSVSLAFSYLAFFASMLLYLMSAHALIYRPIVKLKRVLLILMSISYLGSSVEIKKHISLPVNCARLYLAYKYIDISSVLMINL